MGNKQVMWSKVNFFLCLFMKILPRMITLLCFANFTFINPALINPALAWDGFDQETNDAIEITSGNLVREGLVIEFYVNDELHMGRVVSLVEAAGGSELVLEDLNEDGKERMIIMD